MKIETKVKMGIVEDLVEGKLRNRREKIRGEYKKFIKVYRSVLNRLSKEELDEFDLEHKGRIGHIYLDKGVFKEWESEKNIEYLPVFYMKYVLDNAEENLENLKKLIEEIILFYSK